MPKRKQTNESTARQKEIMKKRREEIRNDPSRYEEEKRKERERYHRRKAEGKIKTVSQMTDREVRSVRKQWRKRSQRHWKRKKAHADLIDRLEQNSPPPTPPLQENINPVVDRRAESGKLRRRRHLRKLREKVEKLEKELKKTRRHKEKYKKKVIRFQHKMKEQSEYPTKDEDISPGKSVELVVQGQEVTSEVKRRLLFGEVIKKQLQENYKNLKQFEQKRTFCYFISNVKSKINIFYSFGVFFNVESCFTVSLKTTVCV